MPPKAQSPATCSAPIEGKQQGGATLFSKLGGIKAVRELVKDFYERILQDENLAPFFVGVNMAHMKRHQVEFLKVAFTQIPDDLDIPKMLIEKHMRLFRRGLNSHHFDAVAGHLVDALKAANVDAELVDEALGIVAPLRNVFEQATQDYGMGVEVAI